MANVAGIAHIVVIVAVAFQLFRKQTALRNIFWAALVLKLISGIILGLIYTSYYSVADTLAYFSDAAKIAGLARQGGSMYWEALASNLHLDALELHFHEPRALLLVKITSFFCLLTFDNYWVIGLYYSLISFIAAWYLVQILVRNLPSATFASVIAFLFLPSVVFWTSGLLKESLAIASLFFLSGVFLKVWFRGNVRWWEMVLAVPGLWLFWSLKYYFAGVFFAVAFAALIYKHTVGQRLWPRPLSEALTWFGILTVPMLIVTWLHPNLHLDRLLEVVVLNNAAYNEFSSPDGVILFSDLQPTPISMLSNAPQALFSGLFRPLIWEVSSPIQFLPALENTVLLLLAVAAVTRVRAYRHSPHRLLILCVVVYVLTLAGFLAMSAPNFGTLSRYRSGYISFFVFIILCNNPLLEYVERSLPRLVSK